MFSGKSCNYLKLRTNLRLAISRLKLLEKKKTELALKARKEIADYITNGKDDRARIRVEHIVREDYMVEAMEIIEMFCDLLLARFGLVEKMKEMDPGLEEAIATILWSAPYLSGDILEMKEIQKQLSNKYSKEYVDMCHRNGFENVNEQVMHKMSIAAPPKILIENYMVEIAKTYKVPFEPDLAVLNDEQPTEAEDLIKLDSASGSIGFESYENEMNERKKPPSPPGFGGGSDFPGFGGGSGGGGGGGIPVMPPGSAPHYPHMPPVSSVPHNPHMPPGGVQVMPPTLLDMNTVPPYEPPPGSDLPGMLPPPIPSMPPNAGIVPSPHWPSEQPLPNYNELVPPPSHPSLPGASPSDASPGFGEDPTEAIMNLPEVPGFPAVPSNPPGGASVGSEDIDFDDLTRRFQDLKKRK